MAPTRGSLRRWRAGLFAGAGLVAGLVLAGVPAHADTRTVQDSTFQQLADADRRHAEQRQDQARQWRELARQADEAAQQSQDPEDRASWEETARDYLRRAEQADDDARRALDAAAENARRAEQERAAPGGVPPGAGGESREAATERLAEEARPPPPTLQDLLGVWRSSGDDQLLVIVQKNPGDEIYPNLLEAHTRERVWQGRYEPFDEGDIRRAEKARLTFTYEPRVEEINLEIPDWARQAVAGRLEWRIELNEAGDDEDPRLEGRFLPGEVEWHEAEGGEPASAEVSGPGIARPLHFTLDDRIELEAMSRPVLTVRLPGMHDPLVDPLEALLKRQRFLVRVQVPPDAAREIGPRLTVQIRKAGSEDGASLTLEGHAPDALHPVIYSHPDPVTIADRDFEELDRDPRPGSLDAIFGNTGARLDLSVENGDLVEFRYGDAVETIPVYDSWVQRARVRQQRGAERLRAIYASILADPAYSAEQKEFAHQRSRMLANYERIAASDALTDVHRFHLAERYFGDGTETTLGLVHMTDAELENARVELIQSPKEQRNPSFYNPLVKAFLEGLTGKPLRPAAFEATEHVVWTSAAERDLVRESLAAASDELASRFLTRTIQSVTFGMYDAVVGVTPAGQLYLVATGHDHFGRPVPGWVRMQAALSLGSNALLSVAGSRLAEAFTRPPSRSLALGTAGRVHDVVGLEEGGALRRLSEEEAALPASLGDTRRRAVGLELGRRADADGAVDCVQSAPGSNRLRTFAPHPDDIAEEVMRLSEPQLEQEMQRVKDMYGERAQIVDAGSPRVFYTQSANPTCQAMSANYMVYKNTGRAIDERTGHRMITRVMVDMARQGEIGGAELLMGRGTRFGYTNGAIRRYLQRLGAQVLELREGFNRRVKLRHIEALRREGYEVKAVVRIKPPGQAELGYHAVVVEEIVRNRAGLISEVRFFDPNFGRIVSVPARRFKELLPTQVKDLPYGLVTAVRWNGSPAADAILGAGAAR